MVSNVSLCSLLSDEVTSAKVCYVWEAQLGFHMANTHPLLMPVRYGVVVLLNSLFCVWWLLSSAMFPAIFLYYICNVSPLCPLWSELSKIFHKSVFVRFCRKFVSLPVWGVSIQIFCIGTSSLFIMHPVCNGLWEIGLCRFISIVGVLVLLTPPKLFLHGNWYLLS